MHSSAGQPTVETIVASAALVTSMAALRGRRFGPLRSYLLGFAPWAAIVTVSWGSARALGLSELHFWRTDLETPTGIGALFLAMWIFWRRRLWFLKGLALSYGLLGLLLGLDAVFHFDSERSRSFAISWITFTLACGALTLRRQTGPAPALPDPATTTDGRASP